MSLFACSLVFILLKATFATPPDYGFSSYCRKCISPCEKKSGDYYYCKIYDWLWNNEVYTWDYCSPNRNLDHYGRNCSSACAFHGESYQWCTAEEEWGYCSGEFCSSQVTELPDYGYSTYCQRCITPCQQTKSANYWCGTRKWRLSGKTWSWDYCSPDSGVNYQGNKCLDTCKFRSDDLLYMSCPTGENKTNTYCTGGKGNVLCDFVPQFH